MPFPGPRCRPLLSRLWSPACVMLLWVTQKSGVFMFNSRDSEARLWLAHKQRQDGADWVFSLSLFLLRFNMPSVASSGL